MTKPYPNKEAYPVDEMLLYAIISGEKEAAREAVESTDHYLFTHGQWSGSYLGLARFCLELFRLGVEDRQGDDLYPIPENWVDEAVMMENLEQMVHHFTAKSLPDVPLSCDWKQEYMERYGYSHEEAHLNKEKMDNTIADLANRRLFFGCELQRSDIIQQALDDGADPNYIHQKAWEPTPLLLLTSGLVTPFKLDAMKLLLDHGAKADLWIEDEAAPLDLAVLANDFDAVSLLLEHDADPNTNPFTDMPHIVSSAYDYAYMDLFLAETTVYPLQIEQFMYNQSLRGDFLSEHFRNLSETVVKRKIVTILHQYGARYFQD